MNAAQKQAVVDAANEAYWEIMAKRNVKSTQAMVDNAGDCMQAAIVAALREFAKSDTHCLRDDNHRSPLISIANELESP